MYKQTHYFGLGSDTLASQNQTIHYAVLKCGVALLADENMDTRFAIIFHTIWSRFLPRASKKKLPMHIHNLAPATLLFFSSLVVLGLWPGQARSLTGYE